MVDTRDESTMAGRTSFNPLACDAAMEPALRGGGPVVTFASR
jgi:hypothetical protein